MISLMSSAEKPPSVSAERSVQAKLVPGAERHHGADDQDTPRALVEMPPRPHLAPDAAIDRSPGSSRLNARCAGDGFVEHQAFPGFCGVRPSRAESVPSSIVRSAGLLQIGSAVSRHLLNRNSSAASA